MVFWERVKHTSRMLKLYHRVETDPCFHPFVSALVYDGHNELSQLTTRENIDRVLESQRPSAVDAFLIKTRRLVQFLYYAGCMSVDKQWWVDMGTTIQKIVTVLLVIRTIRDEDREMLLVIWRWVRNTLEKSEWYKRKKRRRNEEVPDELKLLLLKK